jgi:hypothetical protein
MCGIANAAFANVSRECEIWRLHGSECESYGFWNVMLCSVVYIYWRFGGTCCLHLQVGDRHLDLYSSLVYRLYKDLEVLVHEDRVKHPFVVWSELETFIRLHLNLSFQHRDVVVGTGGGGDGWGGSLFWIWVYKEDSAGWRSSFSLALLANTWVAC